MTETRRLRAALEQHNRLRDWLFTAIDTIEPDELKEVIRELLEADAENLALSEPQAAQDWQPIETAPKDGTTIIAYSPGGTYQNGIAYPACVGTAYWRNADTLNPGMWCGPYNPRGYPTHWQPMPAPPVLSAPPEADKP